MNPEERIFCHHCGEVIGVYEPAVVVNDGVARETSRAAEPYIVAETVERYHRSCYCDVTSPTSF